MSENCSRVEVTAWKFFRTNKTNARVQESVAGSPPKEPRGQDKCCPISGPGAKLPGEWANPQPAPRGPPHGASLTDSTLRRRPVVLPAWLCCACQWPGTEGQLSPLMGHKSGWYSSRYWESQMTLTKMGHGWFGLGTQAVPGEMV